MTIRGLLVLCTAFALAIGIAVLFNDIGNAIEAGSVTKAKIKAQLLNQQAEEWDLKQEERKATSDERIAAQELTWEVIKMAGPVALVGIMFITLYLYNGWSRSEVKKANFQATQLRIDPKTGAYPVVFFTGSSGRLMCHDANNKMTLCVENETPAIKELIATSTALQLQLASGENMNVSHEAIQKLLV